MISDSTKISSVQKIRSS